MPTQSDLATQSTNAPSELRHDAVGLLSTLSLGLASVAPAYSITVTLGFVVMVAGNKAPAALLVGFVPILFTAFAFRELNRRMPDCGTNFVWITRAFGPWAGLLLGTWVPLLATMLAMSALAQVGASSLLALLGFDTLAANSTVVLLVGLALIGAVTTVACVGIELSGRVQIVMVALQIGALLIFGVAALWKGDTSAISLSWFNPGGFPDFSSFTEAVMLALFIYWGWDAALTVNEESHDGANTPGKAAVLSTLILLGTYTFTAVAALSFAGVGPLSDPATAADVLGSLAPQVLAGPLAFVVQLAVVVSAIAALLTCVVASARPLLSVSRHGALPIGLSAVHPTRRTPQRATILVGCAGAAQLVMMNALSPNFVGDALLSIGLMICIYYSATALACVAYFHAELLHSPAGLLTKGLLPLAGALMMLTALVLSVRDTVDPDYGYTSFLGIGGVFLLGVGGLMVGAVIVIVLRFRHPEFFRTGRTSVAELLVSED